MSGSLAGRVAVVTGASRGIGLATARTLAGCGARVALLARGEARLDAAAEAVGEGSLAVPTDVSQPDSVRAAFDSVARHFGRLDLLVNNAAVARLHTLESASDDDLAATVGTNLLGVLYCTRAAIPLLRTSGDGVVVNISSEGVRRPAPYLAVYLATKGAVEMLSFALRDELRSEGIRVTLLRCGGSTGGFASDWDPEDATRALSLWRRIGFLDFVGMPVPAEVIADAVVHAATRPRAASVDFLELRSALPMPGLENGD